MIQQTIPPPPPKKSLHLNVLPHYYNWPLSFKPPSSPKYNNLSTQLIRHPKAFPKIEERDKKKKFSTGLEQDTGN